MCCEYAHCCTQVLLGPPQSAFVIRPTVSLNHKSHFHLLFLLGLQGSERYLFMQAYGMQYSGQKNLLLCKDYWLVLLRMEQLVLVGMFCLEMLYLFERQTRQITRQPRLYLAIALANLCVEIHENCRIQRHRRDNFRQ